MNTYKIDTVKKCENILRALRNHFHGKIQIFSRFIFSFPHFFDLSFRGQNEFQKSSLIGILRLLLLQSVHDAAFYFPLLKTTFIIASFKSYSKHQEGKTAYKNIICCLKCCLNNKDDFLLHFLAFEVFDLRNFFLNFTKASFTSLHGMSFNTLFLKFFLLVVCPKWDKKKSNLIRTLLICV